MNITVPEGKDPIEYVWGDMVPDIGRAASRLSRAVTTKSTLGLREFEAARLRIAQINGCIVCMDWRTERDGVKVEDTLPTPSKTGTPPTLSMTARDWPLSTRSATRWITTDSTTHSGNG